MPSPTQATGRAPSAVTSSGAVRGADTVGSTSTREAFVHQPSSPIPVALLEHEAGLDPKAVRSADRDRDGTIDGPSERGALWDAVVSTRDRFERTSVVRPPLSFPRPVATPDARRLAAVEHAAMIAAVPSKYPAIRDALRAESALSMQPHCRSYFVPAESQPARGMVMLLHGFSAGTWQYDAYAEQFARRGYDVYVPRLVGHGHAHADGTGDLSRIPSSEDASRWAEYAGDLAGQVQGADIPVHVIGLSGGGAVALNIAARFPSAIASSTLLDPFLGPANDQAKSVFGAAQVLDRFSFGQGSRLLGLLPSPFVTARRDLQTWGREGHFAFNAGHIAALAEFGASTVEAMEKAGTRAAPLQVITTSAEAVVDRDRIARSVRAAGGGARNGFYDFPAAEKVPHAMVSGREMAAAGRDPAIADRVWEMIFQFVDEGRPAQRPPPGFTP